MSYFSQILQFLISGFTIGSTYALIALGFSIVYNSTSSLDFTQGSYVMLGGMIGVTLYVDVGLPVWAAFPLTVIIVVLVAFLFERLVIYPSKEVSVVTTILLTTGCAIFIRRMGLITWRSDPRSMDFFMYGGKKIMVFGATILMQGLWIILATIVITGMLSLFFKYTLVGKTIRATSVNKEAAKMVGIDVKWMIAYTFILAGILGGIAGFVMTPLTLMSFVSGEMLGMKGLYGAVLGGLGSFHGAICGGLLLGILESLGAGIVSSGYKDAIAFFVVIIVLLVRPAGMFGIKKMSKV